MEHVNLLYKDFQRFLTMLLYENISSLCLHQIIGFLSKLSNIFFSKSAMKRTIRRCKLCFYCSLKAFLSNSNMLFFNTTSISSAKVSLEISLLSLVSKNLRKKWYIRVKTDNVHGKKNHSIWQTSKIFDLT